MTREERIKLARESLHTEHSKEIFDGLIKLYPDAYIFWNCGDDQESVELVIKDIGTTTIIEIAGYN